MKSSWSKSDATMAATSAMASIPAALSRCMQRDLLDWFAANRRALPWRVRRTPYRVWISELMLQQTRADQVIPYFRRFMREFPTLRALAAAKPGEVMKMWEGLGYYRRALRAHQTARHVEQRLRGRFPDTYHGLLALPGVGPYTAAAVASLAFGLDHPVMDGNVIRVVTRLLAIRDPSGKTAARKRIEAFLRHVLPAGRAAEFNEAMMELGALVCTPARPSCFRCPLAKVCRARRDGDPEHYPVRAPKKALPHRHVGAAIIMGARRRVLIAQRKESSMLGGLWEFPGGGVEDGETLPECIRRELKEELGLDVRVGPHLITVRHAFSHFRMDLHAYWVRVNTGTPKALHCADFKWVPVERISRFALPRADQKILEALSRQAHWPVF